MEISDMTKRDARVMAMQILYASDFNNVTIDEAIKYYDETPVDPLALKYVKGIEANLEKIDDIISKSLVNYTISRLNLVDKQFFSSHHLIKFYDFYIFLCF